MFQALLGSIQDDMLDWMFHIESCARQPPPPPRRIINPVEIESDPMTGNGHPPALGGNGAGNGTATAMRRAAATRPNQKVGRNDPVLVRQRQEV